MSRVKAIGVIEHMVSTMDYIISSMAGTSFPEVRHGCVVIWESNCESQASKQARAHLKKKGGNRNKDSPLCFYWNQTRKDIILKSERKSHNRNHYHIVEVRLYNNLMCYELLRIGSLWFLSHKLTSLQLWWQFQTQVKEGGVETKIVPYASIEIRQGKI
jgi:hypothetical protein